MKANDTFNREPKEATIRSRDDLCFSLQCIQLFIGIYYSLLSISKQEYQPNSIKKIQKASKILKIVPKMKIILKNAVIV